MVLALGSPNHTCTQSCMSLAIGLPRHMITMGLDTLVLQAKVVSDTSLQYLALSSCSDNSCTCKSSHLR